MRRMCNKNVIFLGLMLCMIAAVCGFLKTEDKFHAAVHFFHKAEKDPGTHVFTSTEYRYEKEFQNTLNHYRTFASLYEPQGSTPVPGLESTDVLGNTCSEMVPQGICVAGDYMLMTAYDNGTAEAGSSDNRSEKKNRSVMYVLSNQKPGARRLLTTIVLPDVNHVGGVAFDGRNVWIAKSSTRTCSVISYDVIQYAAAMGESSYDLAQYDQTVDCGCVASFLTYHKGKLWVGTYSNRISRKGTLRGFEILQEETPDGTKYKLEKQEEVQIPEYANGASFLELGGTTYLAVAASKGRCFDSKIYFYHIMQDQGTGKNLYYQYDSCSFPPMAEEFVCDGENTYFLFESSATCYSTKDYWKCSYPVDRICALSTLDLFLRNHGEGYQSCASRLPVLGGLCIYDELYQERRYWQQYQG